jgi:hypothetical protein
MVKTKDKGLILLFFILKNDGIGWNGVNTHLFKVHEQKNSLQNLSQLKE